MRLLERNKQKVYYRNFISQTAVSYTDEYGNTIETGEKTNTYGEVKSVRAYVKSAIGQNEAEPFGDFTSKRRTIYVEKDIADINEYSLLWVGIDPQIDDETGEPQSPHNFTVEGISSGLNHDRILIRRVEVNLNGG